jgi:hypothetical protein
MNTTPCTWFGITTISPKVTLSKWSGIARQHSSTALPDGLSTIRPLTTRPKTANRRQVQIVTKYAPGDR